MTQQLGLFNHLTHRANLKHTRYGWLRLTPAYSIHLVEDILDNASSKDPVVLDPFCGTGTTALVCAERGIAADTIDINPFLLWLTETKTQSYDTKDVKDFRSASEKITDTITSDFIHGLWIPSIHQIEKWWHQDLLQVLGQMMDTIRDFETAYSSKAVNLLKIAFCRVMIAHSSASFNHQSMSFKKQYNRSLFSRAADDIKITWKATVEDIYRSAQTEILLSPRVYFCDARQLSISLPHDYYTCVITSPPYPNRMSYIRELRPYMYWLGYLNNGREAGELDWKAIGGTWGIATSNVGKWFPPTERSIPYADFTAIIGRISKKGDILSRYVHKYFFDMIDHINELFIVVKSGGSINYIVGNSKFYDVLLPVEEIFAALFEASGFVEVRVKPIRKRTSKKELFEYIVSATKP
jgi:DNA modification methylase